MTEYQSNVDVVLCFNAGSSTLKFGLFRFDDHGEHALASGIVSQLGTPQALARLEVGGLSAQMCCPNAGPVEASAAAIALLKKSALPRATVVGHRVVHGGQSHVLPCLVDDALLHSLRQLVPLAPLHLPVGILGLEAALQHMPNVPHVACFDTAFHAQLPERAARYPLPAAFYAEGVRRYGFHGLSYEFVMSTLGVFPPNRVIVAHLGSGASLAAVREGRSIDTTMGFTPSGGIPMGTRAGDMDPGLLFYLQREKGLTPEALQRVLEYESGLLGIGGSADLRALSQCQEHDPRAHLAILMFGYAVRKTIGAYFAALGGVDVLVFTGGIGASSAQVRRESCYGLSELGIRLDDVKNERNEPEINAGRVPVLVVSADENRMIARHARAVLHAG